MLVLLFNGKNNNTETIMKDKKLRELLKDKGIINSTHDDGAYNGSRLAWSYPTENGIEDLRMRVQISNENASRSLSVESSLRNENSALSGRLAKLEAKFHALTTHMMLIVAKPEDKFTVTDLNK